jgi:hypothetical protein
MTLRQLFADHPEVLDYDLCFTKFLTIDHPSETKPQLTVVADFPILGVASNEESKEVRFIIEASCLDEIRKSENKIIHLVDQKLAELRDEDDNRRTAGQNS